MSKRKPTAFDPKAEFISDLEAPQTEQVIEQIEKFLIDHPPMQYREGFTEEDFASYTGDPDFKLDIEKVARVVFVNEITGEIVQHTRALDMSAMEFMSSLHEPMTKSSNLRMIYVQLGC